MGKRKRAGRAAVLACLGVLITACDFQVITNGGSGTGTGTGTGTGGGGGSPTSPTPIPNPNPGSPQPGNRTPDPAAGSILPFPAYAESVVAGLAITPAGHCVDGTYLDAAVAALRAFDTRWGYQCRDAACSTLSLDRIAYHATSGADVRGAMGVWTVDVIASACENPTKAWQPDGYNGALWYTPSRY